MAEGGSLQSTVDASGKVYDFNCSICIRKKSAYSEAVFYCPECNEYFCKQCHYQFACDHGTLGRAKVDKWGKPSNTIQFDECPLHKANTIQLYCPREDVVCCAVCGQTSHKNCGQLKYIPLIVSGKRNKEYLKRVQGDLKELKTATEQLQKDKTTKLAELETIHKQLTQDIGEVKANLIAVLDNLEQQSLNEVNKLRSEINNKFKSDLKQLHDIRSQISYLQDNLSKANIDDSLMFARIKQGNEMVQCNRKLFSDMSSSDIPNKAQFIADSKLVEFVKNMKGLGTLVTDTTDKPQAKGVGKVSKTAQGQYLSHSSLKVNQPYKVRHITSFNFKIREDKETCYIGGMCQLPDGSIIVADYNNKRLKQFDSTYKVISNCPLSDYPRDVCNTEVGEVALALWDKTIQFVAVGDKMTATHSFSTSQYCCSLIYHNNCLYVASAGGSNVYVYKPSGSLLHTISTDQHGTRLFSSIQYITASPVSGYIYVTDGDKGLVSVDLEGNLLTTFQPLELAYGACAVCVDGTGNVFVGEYHTKNVIQVGQEGDRKVAQIRSRSDGRSTWRLCFDNVNTRLLVSSTDCDTITVLQLTQ